MTCEELIKNKQTQSSNLFIDSIYQPLRSGRIWHKVKF